MARPTYLSTTLKTNGTSVPRVGCNADGGFHALYRMPATYSPLTAVSFNGIPMPWHVTMNLSVLKFLTMTSNRSTDESTKRAVPPLEDSSPSTCHGSMP